MFYSLIVLAAISRVLPHPPNFTAVGALALFAGANGSRRTAWTVPLLALVASDVIIGFYNPLVMAFVYGGFAASIWIGWRFLRAKTSPLRIVISTLSGSIVFFVLSNFACWLAGMYPRTLIGLGECYVMALPFFRNTVLGDFTYSAALFGLYELAIWRSAKSRAMRAAS